ncbi:neural cell adhesion molecule 1-like [Manihot esculenta]|uniref:neural cell adhesion molecule 1-like n=1 Tax=Manihot esculenta TaxID=3983 RepID=UPI000B5D790B|nr:neural cell adhesion molecule 1-like [Manihot esculenta]
MDTIKLPKNFTLSYKSMEATLVAFKASKTVVDVTWEVFQAADPATMTRRAALTPSFALVPVAGSSHSAVSRMSVPSKASALAKTPSSPKQTPKEPIALSESAESSSEEGTTPLDVPPIQAMGAIVIQGRASKWARTSEPATESRAAKRTCTTEPARTTPSPSIDKGKKAVEHLSSTPDNELLNVVEVITESIESLLVFGV